MQLTDIENAFVGGILRQPEALDDLNLPAEAINDPACHAAYSAILRIYKTGRPVSLESVAAEMEYDGVRTPKSIAVSILESRCHTIETIKDHAATIARHYRIKQLAELAGGLKEATERANCDPDEQSEYIAKFLDGQYTAGEDVVAGDVLAAKFRDELLSPPKERPIQTRIQSLNDLIGGFQRGDYIIIAAPSTSGKTAFSMDILKWNRIGGHNSLYVCLDQNPRSLMQREYQTLTGMDQRQITRAELDFNEHQKQSINQAYMEYISDPGTVYFYDNACATVSDIRAKIRSEIRKHHIKIMVIDHMQQIVLRGKSENRNSEMSEISRRLKAIALECDIPVVALCQINRGYDSGDRSNWNWVFPRIKKDHLRDSGMIGNDASTIITILNKPVYIGERFGWESPEMVKELARYGSDQWGCELSVIKNKNGRDGSVKCIFNPKTMQFYSPAPGLVENDPREDAPAVGRGAVPSRKRLAPDGAKF